MAHSLVTRRALLAGVAISPWFSRVVRADAKLDGALADVAKARAKLTTLVGPFSQERTLKLLATKVKSTGQLWLQRPDRLRWELDAPDAVVYWVLPDALAFKTKTGTGKVQKGSAGLLAGVLGDLHVMLGGDLSQLSARWEISLIRRDEAGMVLSMTPRDPAIAKSTTRVELELVADLGAPKRVRIIEKGGDASDVVFGAMRRDVAIDPKLLLGP